MHEKLLPFFYEVLGCKLQLEYNGDNQQFYLKHESGDIVGTGRGIDDTWKEFLCYLLSHPQEIKTYCTEL